MAITIKETEKIANLARLEINELEKKEFAEQLSNILKYIEKLNELDTANIQATAHILPITNVFREDILVESLPKETVLALAPDKEKGCFKVPKVIE